MRISVIVLLASLILYSCQYDVDDIYVNPIQPPTTSKASINLNETEDPIIIHGPTQFNFSTKPSNKDQYEAIIKVNGIQYTKINSTTGEFSFVLDPGRTGDGAKKLKIEVNFLSQSQSLSGQLGLEKILVSKEWDLTIDTTAPEAIPSPEVYLEDGKSMVKWNAPSRYSFTELILLRFYLDRDGNVAKRDSIKIPNKQTTILHEASYVGGPVIYRVDLKGYKYYIKGGETSFNVNPLQFTLNSLVTPQILRYNGSPLYNNDIRILVNIYSFPPNQPLDIPVDTRFGQKTSIEIRVVARNPPPSFSSSHYFVANPTIYKGIKIPNYISLEYVKSTNVYLLTTSSALLVLNGNTFETIGTMQYPQGYNGRFLLVSENGQHTYLYGNGLNTLYPIQLENLSYGSPINITTITNVGNQGINRPSISNDNLLSIQLGGTNKVYVINLSSSEVVWQANGSTSPIISPNSKFIYHSGAVYRDDTNNWGTTVGSVSLIHNSATYFLHSLLADKLVVGTKIYSLNANAENGLLAEEQTLSSAYQYDKHSKQFWKIHYYASWLGDAILYNSETLEQSRIVTEIYEPGEVLVFNGSLFHKFGYVLP